MFEVCEGCVLLSNACNCFGALHLAVWLRKKKRQTNECLVRHIQDIDAAKWNLWGRRLNGPSPATSPQHQRQLIPPLNSGGRSQLSEILERNSKRNQTKTHRLKRGLVSRVQFFSSMAVETKLSRKIGGVRTVAFP